MTSSIPPSSSPHGFMSQISSGDMTLSKDQQENLSKIVDKVKHLKSEVEGLINNDTKQEKLVTNFEGFDQLHTDFLSGLNKQSNRGYEKSVKDKFETIHNNFLDELNDIKADIKAPHGTSLHETSLRDILMSHDPKQLSDFFKNASKDSLRHLSQTLEGFSKELKAAFKPH